MPAENDADRFVKLWTQHEPQIRGCVLLWIPDWNDAQDVAQQVSLVLWRKLEQFKPGTSFLSWALGIAKLEAKRYWRQRARDQRLFSDEFIDIVAEDMGAMAEEIEQRRRMLKYCLDRIKPEQRQMLFYRYLQSDTVDDIAQRMGRSVDAVYKSIARLRNSLVECVGRRISLASRQ